MNDNLSFDQKRKKIISDVGKQLSDIDEIGNNFTNKLKADYVGQDISLAPYPDEDVSVINKQQQKIVGVKIYEINFKCRNY